jgi:hypothetical protein
LSESNWDDRRKQAAQKNVNFKKKCRDEMKLKVSLDKEKTDTAYKKSKQE